MCKGGIEPTLDQRFGGGLDSALLLFPVKYGCIHRALQKVCNAWKLSV